MIRIAVEDEVLDRNDDLPVDEPYLHGFYENKQGEKDEFVPGDTEECPECYADLDVWHVTRHPPRLCDRRRRHRMLLAICEECRYIPFKDEIVRLVPRRSTDRSLEDGEDDEGNGEAPVVYPIESTTDIIFGVADVLNEAEDNGISPVEAKEVAQNYLSGRMTDR